MSRQERIQWMLTVGFSLMELAIMKLGHQVVKFDLDPGIVHIEGGGGVARAVIEASRWVADPIWLQLMIVNSFGLGGVVFSGLNELKKGVISMSEGR